MWPRCFSNCCLWAIEIVCGPCKNGVSISYHPLALPEWSPTDFQSQTLWRLLFLCGYPRQRVPNMGFEPLTPQEGFPHLLPVGHCTGYLSSYPNHISASFTLLSVAFKSIFSCKKKNPNKNRTKSSAATFQGILRVALYVIAALVCPWGGELKVLPCSIFPMKSK